MTAVTNYPRITLSSGLVGVVVDTSIDCTLKGEWMCEAMQDLRARAVAAMLRDPDDTSRCLLDYKAASRLTDEDYKAFWKALGYTLGFQPSLDVTILGPDGEPTNTASIHLEAHVRLLQLAERHNASLLLRLSDFYRDVEYGLSELPSLSTEVANLLREPLDDRDVREFLVQASDLLQKAQSQGVPLVVLAD